MSKRKDIIRIGDVVTITNPEVFVRVGYPLTKQIIFDSFTTEQKEAVRAMMMKFGLSNNSLNLSNDFEIFANSSYYKNEYKRVNKILDELAYMSLASRGWGGKERKIYTNYNWELLNFKGKVWERKVVKTGTYVSGGGYERDYWGEWDYDPPYLNNEQTHVLYQISVWGQEGTLKDVKEMPWIEKCNLKKVDVSNTHDMIGTYT